MKTYRLTTVGRRTTLILIIGAILLWIFALSVLRSTLGIGAQEFNPWELGAGKLIPAAVLITMLVAAPLLLWSLWEEWTTSYTVGDDGLTYRTVPGIALHYPWSAIRGLRQGDGDDAIAELIVQPDREQIRNPLLRWLHRQAFGANRVPIYADVEARDELVAEIFQRSGLAASMPAQEAPRHETGPATGQVE